MNKKVLKQLLSLLVALTMMLSFSAVFADSSAASNVPQFKNYVTLGDSIAAGFGPDADDRHGFNVIDFAYHSKVAEAVGAENFDQLGYPAFRTNELRYILDEEYEGDAAMFALVTDCDTEIAEGYRSMYKEAIEQADLITLDIGTNDFFTIPLFTLLGALRGESPLDLSYITDNLDPNTSYGQILAKIAGLLEEGATLPQAIPTFLESLESCCKSFEENWDAICGKIYELNPDVKLVAVGRMNPFNTAKLTDASLIRIGKALDAVSVAMNAYVKTQSAYSSKYVFADVMGTECYELPALANEDFLTKMVVLVHPTHDGHEYMTSQILNALKIDECPFVDVDRSNAAYEEILYCYEKGYLVGTSAHTFAPDMNINRAMFVTTLYAHSGKSGTASGTTFKDVASNTFYSEAVAWAFSKGITTGVNMSIFAPLTSIKRQDMIQMMYRYAGSPKVSGNLNAYSDKSSVSSYAKDAMIWAVKNDLIRSANGKLQPKNAATRTDLAYALAHYDRIK